ncbi:MAG: tRNA (adenosine(37)-N6)-dimethylallyltransferase MiaA [Limosilactobacillus sp.]|uniref:tRNA (adenosine(37)-N6)-dimethylallyltransferase MiaA n=1 Tax=Limosilactobacillus sp. TaxID=2773925 RepID=UPI0026FEF35B|nr:tRNA (adenosine(37)-N6)-dimethylallyltransferase MiaA [Limosilactobacillus sp.]
MIKVIAIVGPTAVGKTALSIKLAQEENGEVISGDSMQVYRKLDIGTAKVTPDEMDGVPHHLIDICDLGERYSAARFKQEATRWIDDISGRDKLPIIAGGTGFYLQAITDNLSLGNDHFDEESEQIRQRWNAVAEEKGNQFVWDHLHELDPVACEKIPVNNRRRIIRALEVIEKTGQKFSDQSQDDTQIDFFLIGLNTDRAVLYERINKRVDIMIEQGLVDEARWLFDNGGEDSPAGKGIGYHELFAYFRGECSLDEAIDKIKLDSRHYAKRQLTWFRNKMDVHWFDLVSGQDTIQDIKLAVDDWLTK